MKSKILYTSIVLFLGAFTILLIRQGEVKVKKQVEKPVSPEQLAKKRRTAKAERGGERKIGVKASQAAEPPQVILNEAEQEFVQSAKQLLKKLREMPDNAVAQRNQELLKAKKHYDSLVPPEPSIEVVKNEKRGTMRKLTYPNGEVRWEIVDSHN